MPSSWSELNVVIEVGTASTTFSFQVVKALAQVDAVFRQGFYVSSNDCARAHFKYKTGNKIQVTDAQVNGSNYGYTVRIASR